MTYVINASNVLISASNVVDIEIPANVIGIGSRYQSSHVFESCKDDVMSLTFLGNSIAYIGYYAFEGCSNLKIVDLSKQTTLDNIYGGAFRFCTNIAKIILPASDKLQTIGNNAFRFCSIEQVIDVTPFKWISGDAFLGCKVSYTCGDNNEFCMEYFGNIFSKDKTKLRMVSYSSTEIIYPKETTCLDHCCFANTRLTEIVLPDQITDSDVFPFHHVQNLVTIFLSKNIVINQHFICSNPKLKHIYIPEGVKTCKFEAIMSNNALEVIHFPASLTDIDPKAFDQPNLFLATCFSKEQKEKLISSGIPRVAFRRDRNTCKHIRQFPFSLKFLAALMITYEL